MEEAKKSTTAAPAGPTGGTDVDDLIFQGENWQVSDR